MRGLSRDDRGAAATLIRPAHAELFPVPSFVAGEAA